MQAVEIVALAQLPPDFSKVAAVAHTLATHAVAAAAADGPPSSRAAGPAAAVLLGGVVVALGALAVRPQAAGVAHADAALKGAVAVVAFGATGLGFGLTLAVALKGDSDGERVLEAHRFDEECFLLFFGATASPGLHGKRNLKNRKEVNFWDELVTWPPFLMTAKQLLQKHSG